MGGRPRPHRTRVRAEARRRLTWPGGVEPVTPKKLIPLRDLEIPFPTFVGMAGFLFFWAMVGVMIGSVLHAHGAGPDAQ